VIRSRFREGISLVSSVKRDALRRRPPDEDDEEADTSIDPGH